MLHSKSLPTGRTTSEPIQVKDRTSAAPTLAPWLSRHSVNYASMSSDTQASSLGIALSARKPFAESSN